MTYTASNIAAIIAPETNLSAPDAPIEHLLTDSRKLVVVGTTLFFALPGVQRKGNLFIPQLYKAGVRHFVVDKSPVAEDYNDAVFYTVPDVLGALQSLAVHHRRQFSIPVIGITGSNGKTVVKEWLYQLLHPDFNIVRSPKSYNSQVGVPLSVWQMEEQHTLGIFEAGISKRGEMRALENIIQPTIGVLTSLGEAHSEGFSSLQQKLEEKLGLFQNVDTIIAPPLWVEAGNKVFTWGEESGSTMQVLQKKVTINADVVCLYKDSELHFQLPFSDEASIANGLTCCSVLLHLGYDAATINERLATVHRIDMRLQLAHGAGGSTLINDSYSADLTSLQGALNFLAQQKKGEGRTVILSDFVESGKGAVELYDAIAQALVQHRIDKVVAIGSGISQYLPLQLPDGMQLQAYPDTESFLATLRTASFAGETVLIKGARHFRFERIVTALETKVHQTVMEINLNALAHNLKGYQSLLQPGTKTMAMVKAFSYGSGSSEIAATLQFHGIDYLGVAYADEGIELRKAGISVPIMVMNADASGFAALVEHSLQPVLYSFAILRQFEAYLEGQGLTGYPVHIEIETGMHRLGFAIGEIEELSTMLAASRWIKVQSAFSHLAASEDAAQDAYTLEQAAIFTTAANQLEKSLAYPFLKHISNSAAIIRHPQLQLDMVRLGIGLYGIEIATESLELQPVATLRSTIAQLKRLQAGDTVSYGRRGVIKEETLVATVRIGYADGYSRRLGNGVGKMWVSGHLAPVIGSVCMDMTMLDVTKIPGVKEGDTVVVFGAELPVQQLADWCGTIPYEIMTGVSQRVKRVYFQE
ncbi:MAG: alanine racemase [Flaviaesturariibacter sp.]|nr:alanine racemase [Flaviaesturariibacter sp.]